MNAVNAELQDIAALQSLGLAGADEARILASQNDPETQAAIDGFREVAGRMAALVAVEPPPSLKGRLMAAIRPADSQRAAMPDGVLAIIRSGDGKWLPTPFPGITMKQLYFDPATGNQSVLVRMEPGSVYPHHHHKGLEHSLVLEGDAVFSDHTLYAGDYEVGGADLDHSSITTKGGCLVFIMRNKNDIIYASH